MADEFDPTLLKKKKKKKKIIASLDDEDDAPAPAAAVAAAEPAAPTEPAKAEEAAKTEEDPVEEPAAEPAATPSKKDKKDIDMSDLLGESMMFEGKKKKKKKKSNFDLSAAAAEARDNMPTISEAAGEGGDLALPMKKKKKKKKVATDDDAAGEGKENTADYDEDRDYSYQELLERVFETMRQKNPEMISGEKRRIVMKPPQVIRVGTRKTAFVNFSEICKLLHRQPDHVLSFMLAELGTSGSVDGSASLVLRGRFPQKQIESVLKAYIREYVTCKLCRSPQTILQKENRLFFLRCETCGSKRSVATIKSGFQAVTGRRAAIRARAT